MVAAPSNWHVSDSSQEEQSSSHTTTSPISYSLLDELTYLPEPDRCMLELRFRLGLTIQEIAALTSRSRSSISRRLSTVNQRLHDPLVQALQRYATEFDKEEREIAMLHFVAGQGINRIGRDRHIPRHRVLTILATVRGWHRRFHPDAGDLRTDGRDSHGDRPATRTTKHRH